MKRLNVNVDDDTYKALRIALIEDDSNFTDWVKARISEYLREREKTQGKGGKRHGKG